MSDATPQSPEIRPATSEQYSHGYGAFAERMAQRPVVPNIAFLLPHLRTGMSLLDCGCGPGTNTVALAEAVAPGPVVGIDLEKSQIELARAYAVKRAVANVRFEAGNVYALPFPDASFDAAFAHMVLQHLKDPAKALEEIFRVLKPGGLVRVRDSDEGSVIFSPDDDPIGEQFGQLYYRFWQHNGGDPYMGRHHRRLLREAGFERIMATASTECRGNEEVTQYWSEGLARVTSESHFADRVIALGWADKQTLEKMAAALRAWGKNPDAFHAVICCEAVAWKR